MTLTYDNNYDNYNNDNENDNDNDKVILITTILTCAFLSHKNNLSFGKHSFC